jgi:hypothetical protein
MAKGKAHRVASEEKDTLKSTLVDRLSQENLPGFYVEDCGAFVAPAASRSLSDTTPTSYQSASATHRASVVDMKDISSNATWLLVHWHGPSRRACILRRCYGRLRGYELWRSVCGTKHRARLYYRRLWGKVVTASKRLARSLREFGCLRCQGASSIILIPQPPSHAWYGCLLLTGSSSELRV